MHSGFYNPKKGMASVLDCLPCLAGYYCPNSGINTPTKLCAKGYYCEYGARYANEVSEGNNSRILTESKHKTELMIHFLGKKGKKNHLRCGSAECVYDFGVLGQGTSFCDGEAPFFDEKKAATDRCTAKQGCEGVMESENKFYLVYVFYELLLYALLAQ